MDVKNLLKDIADEVTAETLGDVRLNEITLSIQCLEDIYSMPCNTIL